MTLLLALITALVVFIISATIILLMIGPSILLRPKRRTAEFYRALGLPVSPADCSLSFEEINVPAGDTIKLNSWLIKSEAPSKGTIIYLHGVADCKIDGIRLAKLLHDHHYNIFLFDSRRHGESGGSYCTYGYYEKHDLTKVIDYVLSRGDIQTGNIGLFGTSMGAAVALQTAAIDKRIRAVVAENSFATLRTIFDDYQKRIIKLPFHYLRNLVIKRSELMANFRANDVSPLDAVQHIHIPVLFIYGKKDHLIRYTYSVKLHELANEPKQIFPIETASHNDTWNTAGAVYEQTLLDFFGKNLA